MKFWRIVLLMQVCAFLISCSEDYTSPLKGQTVSTQFFESGQNSKTITIGNADLKDCVVKSSVNWCVTVINGSSVVINVLPNDTYEERQATIIITDPTDATTLSFQVVQSQNDAILVDKDIYVVPEGGGKVTINIKSNVGYLVEMPSWIQNDNLLTRGLKNSFVVLYVLPNNSGFEREGIVKFVDRESGAQTQILIRQELNPQITIREDGGNGNYDDNKGVYEAPGSGAEPLMSVISNVIVDEIVTDVDWIEIAEKKDLGDFNFNIIINIFPNQNIGSRSGKIDFVSSKNNYKQSLIINQQGKEYIMPDVSSITADYKGQDYYIGLKSNTEFSILTPSWIRLSELSRKQMDNSCFDYFYKIIVDQNNSMSERTGEIVFMGKTEEAKITVKQAGITDIKSMINCYTHITFYTSGFFGSLSAQGCIVNNSPFTIYLTSAKMRTVSHLLVSEKYDSMPLAPGKSKFVDFGDHIDGLSIDGLTCTWTFTFNGENYSVTGYKK